MRILFASIVVLPSCPPNRLFIELIDLGWAPRVRAFECVCVSVCGMHLNPFFRSVDNRSPHRCHESTPYNVWTAYMCEYKSELSVPNEQQQNVRGIYAQYFHLPPPDVYGWCKRITASKEWEQNRKIKEHTNTHTHTPFSHSAFGIMVKICFCRVIYPVIQFRNLTYTEREKKKTQTKQKHLFFPLELFLSSFILPLWQFGLIHFWGSACENALFVGDYRLGNRLRQRIRNSKQPKQIAMEECIYSVLIWLALCDAVAATRGQMFVGNTPNVSTLSKK